MQVGKVFRECSCSPFVYCVLSRYIYPHTHAIKASKPISFTSSHLSLQQACEVTRIDPTSSPRLICQLSELWPPWPPFSLPKPPNVSHVSVFPLPFLLGMPGSWEEGLEWLWLPSQAPPHARSQSKHFTCANPCNPLNHPGR